MSAALRVTRLDSPTSAILSLATYWFEMSLTFGVCCDLIAGFDLPGGQGGRTPLLLFLTPLLLASDRPLGGSA